ncbi:hypothetical protein KJ865_04120 [Myxococcota bacterium]|nr:hypothetical protein [Myxococcota bacterium]
MSPMVTGIIIGAVLGLGLTALEIIIMVNLFKIPLPHKMLIISGRQYNSGGEFRGYRVTRRGTVVIPLLETCQEMDTSLIVSRPVISGAYMKGGLRVSLELYALVGISQDPKTMHNALERFMGQRREDIEHVARETMEGTARGVIAGEECSESDLPLLVQQLVMGAGEELAKLGLSLQHLSVTSYGRDM